MSAPTLLTAAEVASTMNIALGTVRRLIATGELPVVTIGRAVRVDAETVAAYVREHTQRRGLTEKDYRIQ